MYQPPRLVTDQTGGHKLKVSLPGGRYQLSLDDRAVIVLMDDLGLTERDFVPEPFVPFFVAIGDAWFPREHDPDRILDDLETNESVSGSERQALVSYVTEARIPKRHAKRVRSVLEESPIDDMVDPDELRISDLPSIPDWSELSDDSESAIEDRESRVKQSAEKTDQDPTQEQIEELQRIPGIGPKRATDLAEGGIESLSELADSRPVDLASIDGITEGIAAVAVEGAREILGQKTPTSQQLADETGRDEDVFKGTLSTLAAAGIPATEAAPTLRVLYGPSIIEVDGLDGYQAYFLWEAGYQTIHDLIDASVEELTDVYQVGETTATTIKDSAAELVDRP